MGVRGTVMPVRQYATFLLALAIDIISLTLRSLQIAQG